MICTGFSLSNLAQSLVVERSTCLLLQFVPVLSVAHKGLYKALTWGYVTQGPLKVVLCYIGPSQCFIGPFEELYKAT